MGWRVGAALLCIHIKADLSVLLVVTYLISDSVLKIHLYVKIRMNFRGGAAALER